MFGLVEVVADYFVGFFFSFLLDTVVFLSNSRDIRDTQQMTGSSLSLSPAAFSFSSFQ
jgi:hypothetical protein